MKSKFRFISDPGHAWLEVPRSLLGTLGIPTQISKCSYQRGDLVYLEEDCDAPRFIEAYKAKIGEFEFIEVHQEHTRIRGYESYAYAGEYNYRPEN